ncbi:MAG: hypothetical protein EA409_02795 [Saprospirales bacterium]|nr:MAG: hypothetical protein EA409_02795 [Saprospirales bacterium]
MKAIKNKILLFAIVLATGAFFTSCSVTLPVTATSNQVGTKVGSATATGFLGVLFFDQDASIRTAARNGNITRISTVDIRHGNVLGLIYTYETIVTGE